MKKFGDIPPHLSSESKRLWRRLADDYVLDDGGAVTLLRCLCEAFDRAESARKLIRAEGAVVKDRFGQSRPHPAVQIERDSRAQIIAAVRALRLSPGDIA